MLGYLQEFLSNGHQRQIISVTHKTRNSATNMGTYSCHHYTPTVEITRFRVLLRVRSENVTLHGNDSSKQVFEGLIPYGKSPL